MNINYICFVFFMRWEITFSQTGANLKSLITHLFTTLDYNSNVRPKTDQTQPTSVTVDFYLAGISSLDAITETLEITAYLNISWRDEFLTWTPSLHGNINDIHYSQAKVWKPPIALQNGFKKLSEMGSTFINVNVDSTGAVTWLPFETFQVKCPVDTSYFPFDEQTCDVIFVCWGTTVSEINMTLGRYGFQFYDDFSSNGEWKVLKLTSEVVRDVDDVEITFAVTLKRKSGYFVLNVLLPVVILSVLSVFTFVIPSDGGERISYAITVWLAFAVFLTIVGAVLPQSSSNTSVTEIYLILMLVIGSLVVIISAVQVRLVGYSNKDFKIPKFLIRMVVCLRKKRKTKINLFENVTKHEQEIDPSHTEKDIHDALNNNYISWKTVISAMDFVLFWIFLIAVFSITLISMLYISKHSFMS